MGRKESSEDFKSFIADFINENDRAAVIIGASQLDILLYQLLQKVLLPAPTSNDDLLDSGKGLGTFSARINAAYRLGLIDAPFCRALHLIRKIRNAFAHEAGSATLASGAHRDRVRELVSPYSGYDKYREVFAIVSEQTESSSESSGHFRTLLAATVSRLRAGLDSCAPLTSNEPVSVIGKHWKLIK